MLARVLAGAVWLAIPIAHAQEIDTLSLAQAQALSTRERAARLLGATGALATESSVVPGFAPFSRSDGLYAVEFATARRAAGYPGLCQADFYRVNFAPQPGSMMSRIRGLQVEQRYRSVGSNEPLPDTWNETYARELEGKCAGSGSVLAGYFEGVLRDSRDFSPRYAYFVTRAFAKAHAFGEVACVGEDQAGAEPCSNLIREFRALDLGSVRRFDVDFCARDHSVFCVSTLIPQGGDNYLHIHITTDVKIVAGPGDQFGVRAVTVEGQRIVH